MSSNWRSKLDLSISKGLERHSFLPSPMIDDHYRKVKSENITLVVQVSTSPIFVAPTQNCVRVRLFLGIKYLPLEELYRALLLGYKLESLDINIFWTIGVPFATLGGPVEFIFCKQMTKEEWQAELDHLFESFEKIALPYFEQNAYDELLLKNADSQLIGRDGRDLYYKRPVQLFVAGRRDEAIALAEKYLLEIEAGRVVMKPEQYRFFLENLKKTLE